jgi:hypothetical protein
MILVLAMLMTMFAGIGTASAASTYTVIKTQNVADISDYIQNAIIQIDIPNSAALSVNDKVTIHLPSQLALHNTPTYGGTTVDNPKVSFDYAGGGTELAMDIQATPPTPKGANFTGATTKSNVKVFAPANTADGVGATNALNAAGAFVAYPVGDSAIEIQIAPGFSANSQAARLTVEFQNIDVKSSMSGDIALTIAAPSGSGFSGGSAIIGQYIAGGSGTYATVKSVTTMGDKTTKMDSIMLQETVKNSIVNGEVIKLKLPNGFKWNTAATVKIDAGWAFTGLTFSQPTPAYADNDRTLLIAAPATGLGSLGSEGRIYISDTEIIPSDNAKFGDVDITISSDKGNVTSQTVTIAKYANFEVSVIEDTVKEVVAGWDGTEIGSFIIEEMVEGSILPRTVNFTLPNGVKWDTTTPFNKKVLAGDDWIVTPSFHDGDRTLRMSVSGFTTNASKIKFEKLKVNISPAFSGDLAVEVKGSAGIEGSAKVAEVAAPIKIEVEEVNNVVIGAQDQPIANIKLIEPVVENWKANSAAPIANNIVLRLPEGASFAKKPTVKAIEGELGIDKIDVDGRFLTITLDATSTKDPGVIEISDVYVTTNRTVPEGDFKLAVVGKDGTGDRSHALTDNSGSGKFDVATITSAVIAKCVTPAPIDGTVGASAGEFRIDSNIYYVAGVAKVMDVAPYIKGDRTYVPMRYLGEILGAEVVWDDAARTVTLTKGEDVVVFTIGSTTYTVNGEAKTADVAPEITNDRTMLPARFVAEAFGAVVGWDAATQTVLIQR